MGKTELLQMENKERQIDQKCTWKSGKSTKQEK